MAPSAAVGTAAPATAVTAVAAAPAVVHSANTPAPVASAPVARTPQVAVPSQAGAKRKAPTVLASTEPKRMVEPVTRVPLAKSGITLPASHMPAPIKAKPKTNTAPTGGVTTKTVTKSGNGAISSQAPKQSGTARGNKKEDATPVPPETASSGTAKAKKNPSKSSNEADFKNLAQAAVSSLILSTKNGEVAPSSQLDSTEEFPVDTSTAHVKALTGANWVAACTGAEAAVVAANGGVADPKGNGNRAKRQNMTADERARQNRDRNREHARNTRLRKKAYVEELKRTLTELVAQRDKAELEKKQVAQREVEQREVRFRVIEEFLKLRGGNESNYASWAAILDANFALTRPATEFRDPLQGESVPDPTASVKLEKTFTGVADVMAESNDFAAFLQTLGSSAEASEYNSVGFAYSCDRENFFMDDNNAVLDWSANSMGLTMRYEFFHKSNRVHNFPSPVLPCISKRSFALLSCLNRVRGARAELSIRGSIRACFCPASNKLVSACLMFDTGAVLSQLQEILNTSGGATTAEAAAAAQAASHRADAILDSLQMPHMDNQRSGVTVVPQGESSDEGP